MLCIKKSHINNQWIVYNPKNFKHHTHCNSYEIAKVIMKNVNKSRLPITHSVRLIESHIRVAKDKGYIYRLNKRIAELRQVIADDTKSLL